MEMSGTVIHILPKQTGTNKTGNTWEKQDFVIQTGGQYPKKLCFAVWGDKIAKFQIKEGEEITVSFDVESREYMGKYYTDVKAWNVSRGSAGAGMPASSGMPMDANNAFGSESVASSFSSDPVGGEFASSGSEMGSSEVDDLPF